MNNLKNLLNNLAKPRNALLLWSLCVVCVISAFLIFVPEKNSPQDRDIGRPPFHEGMQGSVQGVETRAAVIEITNTESGRAKINLVLGSPTQLAGVEVYFKITEDLRITSLSCGDLLLCAKHEVTDDSLSLSALRVPDIAKESLSGTITIAEIEYDTSTQGALTINSSGSPISQVVEVGSTENLMQEREETFRVGY